MSGGNQRVYYKRKDLPALFRIVDDLREQFPTLGTDRVAAAVGRRYESMELGRRGGFEPDHFESLVAQDLAMAS